MLLFRFARNKRHIKLFRAYYHNQLPENYQKCYLIGRVDAKQT